MVLAITGHRPSKLGNDYDLVSPLTRAIEERIVRIMYERNPERVILGMALGIDTLMAKICISLGCPFTAAIPCKGQDRFWPRESRDLYHQILSNPLCTVYIVTEGTYTPGCMNKRNEWMVNQLVSEKDALMAVWDGTSGGTANCVKYAEEMKKEIIRIDPNLIKLTL